jgi:glycosyltransferase involved in cell wall biosynthesis
VRGHKISEYDGANAISVVVPVYNRWHLLPRALESVQNQTYPSDEILVVDDGSDQTVSTDLLESFPDVQFFRQENKGVASARNLGIKKASGDWIALLDSDDEWEPTKLEKQLAFLKKFPEFRVIHTGERWIRNENEVSPPAYLDKSNHLLWERSLSHCLICPSSVLLHCSIFETVGLFDEKLTVCEDYDFWLRLLLQEEVGLVDEKLVIKHGGHDDQLSTTTWGMDRFRVMALQKILNNPLLSNDRKVNVLEVLLKKCDILAQGAEKRGKLEEAQKYKHLSDQYSVELGKQPALTAR